VVSSVLATDKSQTTVCATQDATKKLPQPSIDLSVAENISEPSCIWDTAEINVLRKEFRSVSDKNAELRGRLMVLESDLAKLTKRDKQQQKHIFELTTQVKNAVSANERLQMLVKHLKNELLISSDVIRQLHLSVADKDELVHEKKRLECELSAERSNFKQLSVSIKAELMAQLENQRINEAVIQGDLKRESAKLLEKVEELTQQLEQERLDHSRTQIGLQHLRIHFATLPSDGAKRSTSHQHSLTKLSFH